MQALTNISIFTFRTVHQRASTKAPCFRKIPVAYASSTKAPSVVQRHHNNHVSREEYRVLVQEVDFRKTELRLNDKIDTVKTDISKEISSVRTELKDTELRLNDKIDTVRTDLTKEINSVRTDLTKEISSVRTELKDTEIRLNDKIDTVKTDLSKEINSVRTDLSKEISTLAKEISTVSSNLEKLGTGIYRALFGAVLSVLGIIGGVIYSHPDGRRYLADIVRGEPSPQSPNNGK
jgi:DNA anti-recombination protein RmuC